MDRKCLKSISEGLGNILMFEVVQCLKSFNVWFALRSVSDPIKVP